MTSAPQSASQLIARSKSLADRLSRRERRVAARIERFQNRLESARNIRIGAALIFFVILVFFATQPKLNVELPVVTAFALVFAVLVMRTRRIERHLKRLRGLQAFFDRQEKRCRGLASGRPWDTVEKLFRETSWSRDLGIFGAHSLWTLLDETLTDDGEARLVSWITAKPLPTADILTRQRTIQALRHEHWFFTRWALQASRSDFRLSSSQILKFLKKPFVEKGFWLLLALPWIAWLGTVALICHWTNQGTSFPPWLYFVFPAVNFFAVFKAGSPFLKGVGLSHHLSELEPIFRELERRAPRSERLKPLASVVSTSGPSREARRLNRVLAFLSVQANPIASLLVNFLSPWSITATHFLERRRRKIAYTFPQCLEELAELEALGSLVIFDRYQTSIYPEIHDSGRRLEFSFVSLFHPLIDRKRVIENDFSMPTGKSLGLITGSNMSGKSTFLRALGINQVLANMGAPVFADSFITSAHQIETCIEVSDSLRDGYSYFYAEVRRLKALVDAAHEPGSRVLFLIDEIFRGTNNRERQIGSRSIIRSLATETPAIGFISTHDLELTALETTHERVLNLHFREEFSPAGEMVFSYMLRTGPCPTTNALKIMAREGLPVDEPV